MAIQQKPGITHNIQTPQRGGATTGPIARTGTGQKSAFEEALARQSAAMGRPAAAGAASGDVDPASGMTKEQSVVVERTLGQHMSRTILSMPKPKARAGDAEGGIDGD